MADDILKPETRGNSRAAQTRIKGKSAGAMGGQRAHDLRIGPQPGYVDPSRAHLNRVLIAPQTGTQLRKVCEERRALRATARAMKSSAAVGVAGIITFGHEAQKLFERLTREQQDAAYRETAQAIAARLNSTLTGLVVHADESAPHAHFQLPAYDLTGHPISETAKRGALRDLQTITAEVMGRHAPGIERGRSKLDRLKAGATPAEVVNRSVAQLHDDLPIEIAAKEAQLAELDAKIEKNERLAASALEKAATNEGKSEKALKNAALYEQRADKARQQVQALKTELADLRSGTEYYRAQIDDLRECAQEAWKNVREAEEREAAAMARLEPVLAAEAALTAHENREREREAIARKQVREAHGERLFREFISAETPLSGYQVAAAAWCITDIAGSEELRRFVKAEPSDTPDVIAAKVCGADVSEVRQRTEHMGGFSDVVNHLRAVTYALRTMSWSQMVQSISAESRRFVATLTTKLTDAFASVEWRPATPPPETAIAQELDTKSRDAIRQIKANRIER